MMRMDLPRPSVLRTHSSTGMWPGAVSTRMFWYAALQSRCVQLRDVIAVRNEPSECMAFASAMLWHARWGADARCVQEYHLFTNVHLCAANMADDASTERWRPALPPHTTLLPHRIDAAAQPNARDCGIYALTFMHRLVAAILRSNCAEGIDVAAVQQILAGAAFGRDLQLRSAKARRWWADKMLCHSELGLGEVL